MMPRLDAQSENRRDARDLRILELLDEGLTQAQAAKRVGAPRGPVARLLADIRKDDAS